MSKVNQNRLKMNKLNLKHQTQRITQLQIYQAKSQLSKSRLKLRMGIMILKIKSL